METIKQKYFDSFSCTAEKCSFTCCSGWDINVDFKTYRLWKKENLSYEKQVKKTKNGYIIKKRTFENCPYIKNGLCKIILEKGEKYISGTCRSFPRVENMQNGYTELSLSCACIEAAKIIAENNFEILGEYAKNRTKILEKLKSMPYIEHADLFNEPRNENVNSKLKEINILFYDIIQNYKKVPVFKPFLCRFKNYKYTDWEKFSAKLKLSSETIKRLYMSKFFEYCPDDTLAKERLLFILLEYILMRHALFLSSITKENIIIYTAVFSRIIGNNEEAVRDYFKEIFGNEIPDKKYICALL
ncbi:MAG: flagellin lysine-N-methylase [Clostridia bacterium]|jgi:lysine-N-methylase|nr:flagellin lysine-N-methylase [Clostridia bacterium]MCI1999237.1 flagellin lysine-N-methylase [Clostridia bacterium]MCI2014810.1 flagellin lysine-N-methylase [Clostridia bacterium]